jgi:RHS repeat-associated protein
MGTCAPDIMRFGIFAIESPRQERRSQSRKSRVVSPTLSKTGKGWGSLIREEGEKIKGGPARQKSQSRKFRREGWASPPTAQSAATSGSDCWGQSYGYDRYGNLLSQTVTQCSGPSWSVSASYKNQIAGFSYDAAGNLTFDGINSYQYDAEGRLININSGAMTYTYDAMGQRVYKDGSGQATSYINFGGQVLAEVDSNSSDWSDYIYGNGQRIARADTYEDRVHISGNNCSNCGWQYSTFSFANVAGLSGYVIQSGDHLFLRQFQSSGARGGITLSFASGQDMNWVTYDQDGQQSNSDTITNSWHYRNIDMSQWAGESVTAVTLVADGYTAPGSWDIYYQDIALVSANGTVHPIYSRETSMSLSIGGTDGSTRTYEVNHCCDGGATPETTTTYYSGDILGSIALLTSYNGYPVWSGTYLPFGYEWNPETTVNHYKFTGMERDSQPGETGLDHTWFRQYNSTMGRWMTPDPAGMAAADPTNPQTWNRYAYVGNNPLSFIDPLGACQVTSAYMNGYLVSTTYTIDNFDPCIIGSLPPGCGLVNTDRGFAGVFCSAAPSAPAMGATGDGSGAANNGQQPDWFKNQNCQIDYLNSQYGQGTSKFVSRFSLLGWTPLASGASANASETVVPTVLTEGAKVTAWTVFKLAGSAAGKLGTEMASFIPTLYGTALDAEAKFQCRNVTAFSGSW